MRSIIIIIIIVIIILFLLLRPSSQENFEPFYRYQDIRPYLKTGDIMLFSCKKHQSIMDEFAYYCRTALIGSEYGHIGLVMRNENGLYLVECTGKNHLGDQYAQHLNSQRKGGVRILELDTLLEEYNKAHAGYFAVRLASLEIPNGKFLEKMEIYRDKIFENKQYLVLLAIVDICISHQMAADLAKKFNKENRLMCSEFVHNILYHCGVLKDYPSKIFWPHSVTNGTLEKLDNVNYSKIYKFTL